MEKLEQLLTIAKRLGYIVRYENLIGIESGVCNLNSKRILFLDLNQSSLEHIEVVRSVIESDPSFLQAFNGAQAENSRITGTISEKQTRKSA